MAAIHIAALLITILAIAERRSARRTTTGRPPRLHPSPPRTLTRRGMRCRIGRQVPPSAAPGIAEPAGQPGDGGAGKTLMATGGK